MITSRKSRSHLRPQWNWGHTLLHTLRTAYFFLAEYSHESSRLNYIRAFYPLDHTRTHWKGRIVSPCISIAPFMPIPHYRLIPFALHLPDNINAKSGRARSRDFLPIMLAPGNLAFLFARTHTASIITLQPWLQHCERANRDRAISRRWSPIEIGTALRGV